MKIWLYRGAWSRGKTKSDDEEWCLSGAVWSHTGVPWIEETVVMIIVNGGKGPSSRSEMDALKEGHLPEEMGAIDNRQQREGQVLQLSQSSCKNPKDLVEDHLVM